MTKWRARSSPQARSAHLVDTPGDYALNHALDGRSLCMTKWFFALSEASPGPCRPRLGGSHPHGVTSARANTTLQPHFLYDGVPGAFTAELQARASPSSITRSASSATSSPRAQDIGQPIAPIHQAVMAGAYLRTEIPRAPCRTSSSLHGLRRRLCHRSEDRSLHARILRLRTPVRSQRHRRYQLGRHGDERARHAQGCRRLLPLHCQSLRDLRSLRPGRAQAILRRAV